MTATQLPQRRSAASARRPGFAERHPVAAFVALTYGVSWTAWLLAFALRAQRPAAAVLVVLGGLGPAVAAAVTVRHAGGSVRAWLRRIVRWRLPLRYYGYALGLPALLYAGMNVALAAFGQDVEWSLLPGRLPAYLATFVATLTVGGALEEFGWRGFALARLERRFPPVRATLVLGLAYTWVYNRSGSILPAILLHASFTPAQEHLILLRAEAHGLVDAVIAVTYLAGVAVLLLATRGRLGYDPGKPPP